MDKSNVTTLRPKDKKENKNTLSVTHYLQEKLYLN